MLARRRTAGGKEIDKFNAYKVLDLKFDGNLDDSSPYNQLVGCALFYSSGSYNINTQSIPASYDGNSCIELNPANMNVIFTVGEFFRLNFESPFLQIYRTDFTIEGWIYTNNASSSHTISSCWDNDTTTPITRDHLLQVINQNITFSLYSSSTKSVSANNVITPQTWHHFAVTLEGDSLRIFVNGVLANTTSISGFGSQSNNSSYYHCIAHYFVKRETSGSRTAEYRFDGKLDDFRLYKGVAKYTSSFTPPARGKY